MVVPNTEAQSREYNAEVDNIDWNTDEDYMLDLDQIEPNEHNNDAEESIFREQNAEESESDSDDGVMYEVFIENDQGELIPYVFIDNYPFFGLVQRSS